MMLSADRDAVLTGETNSPDFPAVRQPADLLHDEGSAPGWRSNAVIARVDSSGRWLEYSLEYGGSHWDSGASVAVDKAGNAFVAGYTGSADFPVTLCCVPRRLFSPARHLTLEVVVQKGAHLYLVGDAIDRDPTGRALGYRGHYLKRWHAGRAADEGNSAGRGPKYRPCGIEGRVEAIRRRSPSIETVK